MPIVPQHQLEPLDQQAFGKLSYEVVNEVLAIRRELGRFFDEKHYKQALSRRLTGVVLESPILLTHGNFKKFYFLDVVVGLGGVFEFKATEALVARHKAQLLHYLMLAELWHGMLINVRTEKLGREFANNALTYRDRLQFEISTQQWRSKIAGAEKFRCLLTELLQDWGTCLDLSLYEEAIVHFCGGESNVIRPANVTLDGANLGSQTLRFVSEKTAFKLTAFEKPVGLERFVSHTQRLVNHTDIECLLWANIGRHEVTLRTITSES